MRWPRYSSFSFNISPSNEVTVSRSSERSYSTFKVRRGGHEKIPHVQGKERWLRFAGAAMKRYPTSKVRETQVRWQVLREGRHTKTVITEN